MTPPLFLNPEVIKSILKKANDPKRKKDIESISFPDLYGFLDGREKKLIKEFLLLNPRKYGFNGKFLGMKRVPRNIICIKNQKVLNRGKIQRIEGQLLPKTVYDAYKKLNSGIKKDLGKKLLVGSGYRSPAYQVIIFLSSLEYTSFNFEKTVRWAAFPGYSEHGDPLRQAIDFMTEEGIPRDGALQEFEKTNEFKWLVRHANKFGFYLSYPKNNKDGIMYEPWHWHLEQ
jgi:LAS superfamily LD-carboxypeptidase LdcB